MLRSFPVCFKKNKVFKVMLTQCLHLQFCSVPFCPFLTNTFNLFPVNIPRGSSGEGFVPFRKNSPPVSPADRKKRQKGAKK